MILEFVLWLVNSNYATHRFRTLLIDQDPLGNDVVKRYGRHWTYNCAVQLEDYVAQFPNADGERRDETIWGVSKIPFEMKIFKDRSMNEEFTNQTKDIGVLSEESQKVLVQATVLADNKFVHLKQCLVKVYDQV